MLISSVELKITALKILLNSLVNQPVFIIAVVGQLLLYDFSLNQSRQVIIYLCHFSGGRLSS